MGTDLALAAQLKTRLKGPVRWTIDRVRNRGGERLRFRCNLCGRATSFTRAAMTREAPSCGWCGSTVRFRAVLDAVTRHVVGDRSVRMEGLGFSDAAAYATHLKGLGDYTNSWFHQEPRRDLMDLASFGTARYDFVVCSEVMEHVVQPVQRAFDNLFALLRPGGALVLSTPMRDGETVEHYPPLLEFSVREGRHGWVVEGITEDGQSYTSHEVVFHGGPGATVEMRVFGRASVARHLAAAGFNDYFEDRAERPEIGIVYEGTPEELDSAGGRVVGMHSCIWVARRPW